MRRFVAFLLLIGLGASQAAVAGCSMRPGASDAPAVTAAEPAHAAHAGHEGPAAVHPIAADSGEGSDPPPPHHSERGCAALVGCGTAVLAAAEFPHLTTVGTTLDDAAMAPAGPAGASFPATEPPPPRLPV